MTPIESVRKASEEEIEKIRFYSRGRGERINSLRRSFEPFITEVLDFIKDNSVVIVSFKGPKSYLEAQYFAQLVRETTRNEEGFEVQAAMDKRNRAEGEEILCLRELPFSPEEWQKRKYGDEELSYLTSEQHQEQFENIKKAIMEAVSEAQQEFQEELNSDYDIVGVIIYGSWTRGNVHEESDIDMIILATTDPVGLRDDFKERLREKGIEQKIEILGEIIITNEGKIKKGLGDLGTMEIKNPIVITPFPELKGTVESALELL